MKERPINMRAEEVRAILAGRKTQFRRVMRTQPLWVADPSVPFKTPDADPKGIINCPFGQPGDRLWARECWGVSADINPETGLADILFRADQGTKRVCRWRPSIHMPRWACRIILEVVSVRVQRLQDISEEDAEAEVAEVKQDARIAAHVAEDSPARMEFWHLWQSINSPRSWDENPWVWVVEFRRLEGAQ